MNFNLQYDSEWIEIRPQKKSGFLNIWNRRITDFENETDTDRSLVFAIAELRMIGEDAPNEVFIHRDRLRISHRVASKLEGRSADAIGLPPLVHLTLKTDVEGTLGSPTFKLRYWWLKFGIQQTPKRIGMILETEDGSRRLPSWMVDAIEMAEAFKSEAVLAEHWEALARFRRALDPKNEMSVDSTESKVGMTEFLKNLEVRLADSFGISPKVASDSFLDFDPVPYSGNSLRNVPIDDVGESHSELNEGALLNFQTRVREKGSLPAYRVGDGSYLVVERSAQTALTVMVAKQQSNGAEREAFVRNPRAAITSAIEEELRAAGTLSGLSPDEEEEAIEARATPIFIETLEYSERVIGKRVYEKEDIDFTGIWSTTWLPEGFNDESVAVIQSLDVAELEELANEVERAIIEGKASVSVEGVEVPANSSCINTIETLLQRRKEEEATLEENDPVEEKQSSTGPVILETEENFTQLEWQPKLSPRFGHFTSGVPTALTTTLRDHQYEGLAWQKRCWSKGLSGVLNADEQGLGKTLQTIAFMRAVQDMQAEISSPKSYPMLVVAPTTLLPTWEAEVNRHVDNQGLGQLIRLYGSDLRRYKVPGKTGVDTTTGEVKLNLQKLAESIEAGNGHRFWILTTYTTLTNYQHSIGQIPFAVVVFDEIQALKNPISLRSYAARAVKGDFRIGLTGTPIENKTADLWAIMDQLLPGVLGTLREFNEQYSEPQQTQMSELHNHLFQPHEGHPPLAMRRIKEQVAAELPNKYRRLHPRLMPESQASVYDIARLKVTGGGAGLAALHHIRSVSVHPDLTMKLESNNLIGDSARIQAAFDVIRRIHERNERALVFIEHRLVQYQFVEEVRREFNLKKVDIINGSTPIKQRKRIVERFQRHLDNDEGFDLLVLGPRAAGTGLTLTAATHVIHLSRWWNPAVEEQCNDRVHRIGQNQEVNVHVPMAIHADYREHSFDCLLHTLMNKKRNLAASALWPMGDTESDIKGLQEGMGRDPASDLQVNTDPVSTAISAMFIRDGKPAPVFETDGSIEYT